ncbi:MAG TPA: hypothetical protein PK431_10855 [Chitinophagales bacterium]|nr:hypothetical protein [Chitinophagales bacterium]
MSYKYRLQRENEIIQVDQLRREAIAKRNEMKLKKEQMKHEYGVELKTWLYKDILQQFIQTDEMCKRIRQRTEALIRHEYIAIVNGETIVTEKGVEKIINYIINTKLKSNGKIRKTL